LGEHEHENRRNKEKIFVNELKANRTLWGPCLGWKVNFKTQIASEEIGQ